MSECWGTLYMELLWNSSNPLLLPSLIPVPSPLCSHVCMCVCVFAGMCMCAGNIIFYSYLIFYVLYTLYIYTGHDLVKCSVQLDTALQK